MTDTSIELHKVECYVVVSKTTGEKTGLMQVKTTWNGMMDLESVLPGGGMLIIDAPGRSGFSGGLLDLFPNSKSPPVAGVVVKGSTDLLVRLFKEGAS